MNCVWERMCFLSGKEEATPKEQDYMLINIGEIMNIVKKSADLCNEDLCLPEDTRTMFSFV